MGRLGLGSSHRGSWCRLSTAAPGPLCRGRPGPESPVGHGVHLVPGSGRARPSLAGGLPRQLGSARRPPSPLRTLGVADQPGGMVVVTSAGSPCRRPPEPQWPGPYGKLPASGSGGGQSTHHEGTGATAGSLLGKVVPDGRRRVGGVGLRVWRRHPRERRLLGDHPGHPGQHERTGGHRALHQRRVPGREPPVPLRPVRLRRRRGVQRAGEGHRSLRPARQRHRWHQRPDDQPDDHELQSDQRVRDARPVHGLDPGEPCPSSRCSTASGRGPATVSSASPSRATPRSSGSGRRCPTGPRRDRPTCGGPGPTTPPSCRRP